MKMTLERARAKLAQLQNRYDTDPLAKSFYMGRVGYRKQTKRYLQSIDKGIDDAILIGKLQAFINHKEIEASRPPEVKAVKVKPEPKPRIKRPTSEQYKLSTVRMAGCVVVYNTARMKGGDCEHIAQIGHDGTWLTWLRKNVPDFVRVEVEQQQTQIREKYLIKLAEDRAGEIRHIKWMLSQGYQLHQITKHYGPYQPTDFQ